MDATGIIILWVLFAMRMISPLLHLPLLHCVSCLTPALILLPLSLIFNANKTQLVRFSRSYSLSVGSSTFSFSGQKLQLSQSVKHLGHILCCNLLDNEDIASIKKDIIRKANCMLHTFYVVTHSLRQCFFAVFVSHYMDPLCGFPLHLS